MARNQLISCPICFKGYPFPTCSTCKKHLAPENFHFLDRNLWHRQQYFWGMMGFLNLKREKPSRFQHAGKCFRRVEPKNQPIEKEHHLTQNLHFFGASSRFPVSITKQFPPCEQVPLVVRRQQMPVSLCGSVTTCCLLHSVRITPPQPQKPGSYTGFAEMANTQKKIHHFQQEDSHLQLQSMFHQAMDGSANCLVILGWVDENP